MSFVVGAPCQFRLRCCADEVVLAILPSPSANGVCVVTSWRLHFWAVNDGFTAGPTKSVDILGCGSTALQDAALCAAWHPNTTAFAVATRNRRLCILPLPIDPFLILSTTPLFTVDRSLDHGMVLGMRGTAAAIVCTTSTGTAATHSWRDGTQMRLITSTALTGRNIKSLDILDFDGCACQNVWCAALADGTVLAARSSNSTLSGAFTCLGSHEFSGVSRVAMNPVRTMFVACGSSLARTRLLTFDNTASTSLRVLGDFAATLQNVLDEQSLASRINDVSWNVDGDTLTVATGQGVLLFHCSGSLLFTSFSRSSHRAFSRPLLANGCRTAALSTGKLFTAGTESCAFEIFQVASARSTASAPHPVWLLDREARLLHREVGQDAILAPPREFLKNNGTLWSASASPDASHVVVAADAGVAVYSRRLKKWRLFGSRQQELHHVCACEPCWVGSYAVALPVSSSGTHKVTLFPRTHLDVASALEVVRLEFRPTLLRSSVRNGEQNHWLLIVDCNHTASIFPVDITVDSINAVRSLACTLGQRKNVEQVCVDGKTVLDAALIGSTQRSGKQWSLGVLCSDLTLTIFPIDARSGMARQRFSDVFGFWVVHDISSSSMNPILLLHCAESLSVTTTSGPDAWALKRHPQFDGESLPVGVHNGTAICASEGSTHVMPQLYASYFVRVGGLTLLHIFAATRFMDAASSPRLLEEYSRYLQSYGLFNAAFDMLVHAVVQNEQLPPLCLQERLHVLRRVFMHLRQFVGYHEIVVKCVRKGDAAFWNMIFDVVGAPHVFLEDCVNRSRIREAAYFVRVLLMERPEDAQWSLENSSVAARRLLAMVVAQHDFGLAHELLRFVALLVSEIDLPAATPVPKSAFHALENVLRIVWTSGSTSGPNGFKTARLGSSSVPVAIRPSAASAPDLRYHEAMHRVLVQNPAIRDMIDIEAQDLLRRGNIVQVVRLFHTFSFDLSHFMALRYASCTAVLDLGKAFETMHVELCLPLPIRGSFASRRLGVPMASAPSSLRNETQLHLAACEAALTGIAALADFVAHLGCSQFAALLYLILGHVSALKRFALDSPALGVQLRKMVAVEPWRAYAPIADAAGLPQ